MSKYPRKSKHITPVAPRFGENTTPTPSYFTVALPADYRPAIALVAFGETIRLDVNPSH